MQYAMETKKKNLLTIHNRPSIKTLLIASFLVGIVGCKRSNNVEPGSPASSNKTNKIEEVNKKTIETETREENEVNNDIEEEPTADQEGASNTEEDNCSNEEKSEIDLEEEDNVNNETSTPINSEKAIKKAEKTATLASKKFNKAREKSEELRNTIQQLEECQEVSKKLKTLEGEILQVQVSIKTLEATNKKLAKDKTPDGKKIKENEVRIEELKKKNADNLRLKTEYTSKKAKLEKATPDLKGLNKDKKSREKLQAKFQKSMKEEQDAQNVLDKLAVEFS